MNSNNLSKYENISRYNKQGGFTLIELALAVIILGIIAAIVIPSFNTDGAKGKTLYFNSSQIGKSLLLLKANTTCYPKKLTALYKRSEADQSFCGVDLRGQWEGPYLNIDTLPENTDGTFAVPKISPTSSITIGKIAGPPTQYYVETTNVAYPILKAAIAACNADVDASGVPSSKGRCSNGGKALTAGDVDSLGTFRQIFDEIS